MRTRIVRSPAAILRMPGSFVPADEFRISTSSASSVVISAVSSSGTAVGSCPSEKDSACCTSASGLATVPVSAPPLSSGFSPEASLPAAPSKFSLAAFFPTAPCSRDASSAFTCSSPSLSDKERMSSVCSPADDTVRTGSSAAHTGAGETVVRQITAVARKAITLFLIDSPFRCLKSSHFCTRRGRQGPALCRGNFVFRMFLPSV